ncbi:MAG: putative metal-dependent rane protease [Chloroflexi bacterium]|jgi:membrane protease YdiL (CAAX protease family)|nr:putative metal-dependent rane protease [Chloroflexota bacterium]
MLLARGGACFGGKPMSLVSRGAALSTDKLGCLARTPFALWKRRRSTLMQRVVTLYLVAIAGVEISVARGAVVPGIVCDAFLILLLLNHYMLLKPTSNRQALPVIALLPLLRIISVTVTFREAPTIYWYVLTGLPVLAAAIITARALDFTWGDLGLRFQYRPLQGIIALTGLPLSLVAYALVHPKPIFASFTAQHLIAAAVILFVFVGLTEEFLFRGLLLRVTSSLFGRLAIVWNAAAFASLYAGSLSLPFIGFMGLVGLLFAWSARRTGSIWGVVLAHSALIVGMTCIWPFVLPR